MGIFSVSSQVFFPYLFIYLGSHLNLGDLGSMLTPGVIVVTAIFVIAMLAILAYFIIMSDKKGKAPFLYPAVTFYIIGLILVFFADTNILYFIYAAVITIVGYGSLMIMLGAAVRDFTPEDKAGQLQGIRMIFAVLIPMLIGPLIGNAINKAANIPLPNLDSADVMTTSYIPAPEIFLVAAIVTCLIFALIPLLIFVTNKAKAALKEKKCD